ncbi:MAG: Carboxymuconolactone decarboxylase family protein [Syntrophaceae bacterium PtaU1.Bin231]|nr:MAG: Carboxymuconolactone decarboxylase family protein [Syntrophaceae bacterium PtaU1.Bin231]HOG16069.1 carboxymuconolactone decarboxylase family protein [Syntrophales bacterium]
MEDFYYPKNAKAQRARLIGLKKEEMDSWGAFNGKVFQAGALPVKTKELIAVAAAHVTRCPYCIAGHTRAAKKAGATDEEIAEAVLVAVAMSAGASLAHSNIAMKELEE